MLASVALALAVYQLVLISVSYGKLRSLKILVLRRWHSLGRFLPALGISVWLLLALTWLTSAGDFLAGS